MSASVMASSFTKGIRRSFALASVTVAFLLAGACSSDPEPNTNHICKLNSDCDGGLVCSFGLCHAQCRATKDCPSPQRCVKTGTGEGGGSRGSGRRRLRPSAPRRRQPRTVPDGPGQSRCPGGRSRERPDGCTAGRGRAGTGDGPHAVPGSVPFPAGPPRPPGRTRVPTTRE